MLHTSRRQAIAHVLLRQILQTSQNDGSTLEAGAARRRAEMGGKLSGLWVD